MPKRIKYEDNHKIINGNTCKKCNDCENWFPMNGENFNKTKSNKDGFFNYCKDCLLIRNNSWQNKNRDKMRSYFIKCDSSEKRKQIKRSLSKERAKNGKYKQWVIENKEKVREYGENRRFNKTHDITNEEWELCKEFFGYECAYCGLSIDEEYSLYNQDFHKDHIDNNGSNEIDNCVPACKSCNGKKWKSEFVDWYTKENPIFSENRLNKIFEWFSLYE